MGLKRKLNSSINIDEHERHRQVQGGGGWVIEGRGMGGEGGFHSEMKHQMIRNLRDS